MKRKKTSPALSFLYGTIALLLVAGFGVYYAYSVSSVRNRGENERSGELLKQQLRQSEDRINR